MLLLLHGTATHKAASPSPQVHICTQKEAYNFTKTATNIFCGFCKSSCRHFSGAWLSGYFEQAYPKAARRFPIHDSVHESRAWT